MLSHSLQSIEGSREPPPPYMMAVASSSASDCSAAPLEKSSTLTTQAAPSEHFEVQGDDLKPWENLALQKNHELAEELRHLTFQTVNLPALMKCASPPFKQLSHLEFVHTNIRFSPLGIERFSPFKFTLEHISFTTCSISPRLFAHLINYFLNLKSISLDMVSWDYPFIEMVLWAPRISRTLERLTVNLQHGSDEILQKALSDLGLKFNELDLKSFEPILFSGDEASLVIRLFGGRATCLRLPLFYCGRRNPL